MKTFLAYLFITALLCACNNTESKKVKATDTLFKDSASAQPIVAKGDTSKSSAAFSTNDTIYAGKGVGDLLLDKNMEEIAAIYGKPDEADGAMGKAVSKWNIKPSGKAEDTVASTIIIYSSSNMGAKDERPKAKIIRLTSPVFKTEKSTGVGTTLAFIKFRHPEIKKPIAQYKSLTDTSVYTIYDDIKAGLAFEVNAADKCSAVIIHKPNQKATDSYIPLYPGFKKL